MLHRLDRIIDRVADTVVTVIAPPRTPSPGPPPPQPPNTPQKHSRFYKSRAHLQDPHSPSPRPPAPPPSTPQTRPSTYKTDKPLPIRPLPPRRRHIFRKPHPRRRKTVHWGTITEITELTPVRSPSPQPSGRGSRGRRTYDDEWVYIHPLKSILKPPTALDDQMLHRNLWAMNILSEQRLYHTYEFLSGVMAVGDDVLDTLLRVGELSLFEDAAKRADEISRRRGRSDPRDYF